eukprot:scaffold57308_cov59-Phaeocystis_antarctica.AAC.4
MPTTTRSSTAAGRWKHQEQAAAWRSTARGRSRVARSHAIASHVPGHEPGGDNHGTTPSPRASPAASGARRRRGAA